MVEENFSHCELCGVIIEHTHKHHLIPQQKSKGMKKEVRDATIDCCKPCGKQVHAIFSNNEMKREFNTLEKLKSDPRIQNWISWRIRHPMVTDIKYHGRR